ncbi:beta-ketoacyl synthase N-terminal-like domain-containing protein [Amycolatopsis sp. NPDC051372]|uniref:beta-ketoacyl synthase N-terminal-like domain-containing protein n=1 Tax=Amycolatopsis sp. NPDC051372 TaxID=3155669 RepID=UPI00341973B1
MTGFDPRSWLSTVARTTDITTQMAVAAADEALAAAGLLEDSVPGPAGADPDHAAVVLGTATAGLTTLETPAEVLARLGDRKISPHLVPMVIPHAGAAAPSVRYSASTISTACAAATDAIAAGPGSSPRVPPTSSSPVA